MSEINITCSVEFFDYLLEILNINRNNVTEGVLFITSGRRDNDAIYAKFNKNILLNAFGVNPDNIAVLNIYSNVSVGSSFMTSRNARNAEDLYKMLYEPDILIVDYSSNAIPLGVHLPNVCIIEYNIARSGVSEVFINSKTHLVSTRNNLYNVYRYINLEIGKHLNAIGMTNYESVMAKLDELKSSVRSLEDALQ